MVSHRATKILFSSILLIVSPETCDPLLHYHMNQNLQRDLTLSYLNYLQAFAPCKILMITSFPYKNYTRLTFYFYPQLSDRQRWLKDFLAKLQSGFQICI